MGAIRVHEFDESLQPATWNRAEAELYDNGVTYLKLTPES